MEVEYELTPDDLYAFQWRAAFNSRIARRTAHQGYVAWFLVLLLIAILPAIGSDGFVFSRISFLFLFVSFAFVVLFGKLLEKWLMGRAIRRLLRDEKPGRGQLGRHKVVLQPDGVVEITSVNQTRTSWSGIDRVEQDGNYIYLYTAPIAAHVIPRRAFPSPADAEAFYQQARTSKEAAP